MSGKLRVEFVEECRACGGTGIYVGMAEHDGFGVKCHDCGGTGRILFDHEYREFKGRQARSDVQRVLEANPGIGVGVGEGYTFDSFGGMPYEDWLAGKPFPPKSEMRQFTCPAWWYQGVDYDKKPRWGKCVHGRAFSNCKHFADKADCWAHWDREFGGGRG